MMEAHNRARDTFRYFSRELSWEARRIIPGLDLACVKVAFTDGDTTREGPSHEHMWIGDVSFDGKQVSGTLMNSPSWLTNVNEGDNVKTTIAELGDWMFAVQRKVYGAFTVHLMRSRMSNAERQAHDGAWGLDFGDPDTIDFVYEGPKQKKQNLWGGCSVLNQSQPMTPEVRHLWNIR